MHVPAPRSNTATARRIPAWVVALVAAALACLWALAGGATAAQAATITRTFNGSTWELIAAFRQPTSQPAGDAGIRSLFTTDQNSGLTSTASIFSTVPDGQYYANQSLFGVKHNAYLLEGYNVDGTSRNIQGVITTSAHTWSQLGGASAQPNLALPTGISVTGAQLFNGAGSVTPTARYLAQSTGPSANAFTSDTGDFVLLGVTDATGSMTADALDTAFNAGPNSIGLGLSDGNGVGQVIQTSWAQTSTHPAITTVSAGNLFGGTATHGGGTPTGWVLVWGRPDVTLQPAKAATNSSTITYTLDFGTGTPTGLAASDFTVGGTSTGWSVTGVTGSGSGPYTVTLTGVAPTQGTVTLSLNAGSVTLNGASFPPSAIAASGSTTYDTVPPSVSSFTVANVLPIVSPLTYTLNLNEAPSTPLTASNFIVAGTSPGWSVQQITGSGAGPYTVTVGNNSTVIANGTVTVGVRAGRISDAAGNTGPATQVNAPVATFYRGLDSGMPTVNAFAPAAGSTSTASMTYTVSFDQLVSGLGTTDFSVGGTSTGWSVSSVTGAGIGPYTVTLAGPTPLIDGTLILTLRSGAVTDKYGVQGPLLSAVASTVQVQSKPVNTAVPTVAGTATTNGVLTGANGTWTGPATITYALQWQVSPDGSTGWADATGTGNATATYLPAATDLGKYLRLKVTATNSGGSTVAYSAATARVQPGSSLLAPMVNSTAAQFNIGASGALTQGAAVPGTLSTNLWGATVTPDGAYAYIVDTGSSVVREYAVDAAGRLSVLPGTAPATGTTSKDLVVSPDQRFAYVTNGGSNSVSQYRVLSDGQLQPMSPATVTTGTNPEGLVVNPAGTVLYVAARGSNRVDQFGIDQQTGRLTPLATPYVSAATDPTDVVLTPDGVNAYVVSNGGGAISQFAVGGGGSLTPLSPATMAWSGGFMGAVSPDGRNLYASSYNSNLMGQYSIGNGGVLTGLGAAAGSTGGNPVKPVITPDGANLYVPTLGSAVISQYARNASTGVLTALSPAHATTTGATRGLALVRPAPAATLMRTGLATADVGTMAFTVQFNQWVTGLDASDFSLVGAGAGGWSVQSVTGSGAGPYTVTVTGSGTGRVDLRLAANAVTSNLGNAGPLSPRLGIGGVMGPTPQPAINSTIRVSTATTATTGNFTGEGLTYAWQWQVADSAGGPWTNATGTGNATATYTPAVSEAWKYVRARVTATALDGTTLSQASVARVVQQPEILMSSNQGANTLGLFAMQEDGTLANGTTVAAGAGPSYATASPDGAYAYVANYSGNSISQYSVGADGTFTPLSPASISAVTGARDVITTPDGRFLYASGYSGSSLGQYAIGTDGRLSQVASDIAMGGYAEGLVMNAAGTVLWVMCRTNSLVRWYSINQSTGALTAGGSISTPTPSYGALSRDGQYMFVSSYDGGKLSVFTVGAGGALTAAAGAGPYTLTGSHFPLVPPDGASLLVGTWGTPGALMQYAIGAGGALTARTPASVTGGNSAYRGSLQRNGTFAYIPNSAANTISQFAVSGTGLATPLSPATVATGAAPIGTASVPTTPGVRSIQQVPALANAGTVSWKVQFTHPMTGVDATDFSLGASAGNWAITGVAGTAAGPYTVTASGSGVATPVLTVLRNAVSDIAGNTGPAVARSSTASSMNLAVPVPPTIPSTIRVSQAATGTSGTWTGEGATPAYQWQAATRAPPSTGTR